MAASCAPKIKLPRLNNLSPTVESTFFKIIEESGELARCVLAFLPYDSMNPAEVLDDPNGQAILKEVCSELLDVAQTCVSMIFVLEQNYQVEMTKLLQGHLVKLGQKGYPYDEDAEYFITSDADFKYLHLPRLQLEGVTLLTTACKLQEEIGEAGQYWGKGQGKSGEALGEREGRGQTPLGVPLEDGAGERGQGQSPLSSDLIRSYSLELLDIAQCCFTMMYILQDKYGIDFGHLVSLHLAKLRRKGYCK